MTGCILKSNWERRSPHYQLGKADLQQLIAQWQPYTIARATLLSNGCANTNYKIEFTEDVAPVILRVYTRDHAAIHIETGIQQLLNEQVPVPHFLWRDFTCKSIMHPFAVITCVEGILMRDVILQGKTQAIQQLAYEAGHYLSRLKAIRFTQSGFFNANLSIKPFLETERFQYFLQDLLTQTAVVKALGGELQSQLQHMIHRYEFLFEDAVEANLVHGDYDPSNMLVAQVNNEWRITAILDWEFSLASSYLLDVGMMLRYAQRLPDCYQQSFVDALLDAKINLPSTWQYTAKLMDLGCLLQLLSINAEVARPNITNDLLSLIHNTVIFFANSKQLNGC